MVSPSLLGLPKTADCCASAARGSTRPGKSSKQAKMLFWLLVADWLACCWLGGWVRWVCGRLGGWSWVSASNNTHTNLYQPPSTRASLSEELTRATNEQPAQPVARPWPSSPPRSSGTLIRSSRSGAARPRTSPPANPWRTAHTAHTAPRAAPVSAPAPAQRRWSCRRQTRCCSRRRPDPSP